jgi:hypothetical protein
MFKKQTQRCKTDGEVAGFLLPRSSSGDGAARDLREQLPWQSGGYFLSRPYPTLFLRHLPIIPSTPKPCRALAGCLPFPA